ncbi:hypothetical protein IV203_013924 [Nitzschia inconspicua]|uniref:Uncharacterized protein n=2 Tax=Nitzschia inconspicua TaxID=303405 RepID=A0A9K3M6H5_9STRA|nr:hypothetical protein IV203_013924 [Nitzschia inconspicua]
MNDNTIGSLVPIYGIASPDLGCSCEHHAICGSLVYIEMLVRFKKRVVYSENYDCKTIMAAVWVTEGANRYVIGHVPENLSEYFHRLEGRIAQVYTIYHHSKDSNRMAFSKKNDGVCHAILVEKGVAWQPFAMEQTVGRPDVTNTVAVKASYFIYHDNAATEEFVEVGGNKHDNDHNDSSALSISPGGISRSTRTATTSSRIFNASNTAEGIVGLEKGAKPVAPQPGDYSYSGMHDQGPLPDLKQGGPMALLLRCVEGAKEYNNSFLTTLIEEEKEQKIKLTKSTMSSKTHSISSADSGGPSTKKEQNTKGW